MKTKAKSKAGAIHLLSAREVQSASDGDCSDGGGLYLRVTASGASWVLRYTAPSTKRREMGLGAAYRASLAQAGETLSGARDAAHKARELLRQGLDPIDQREAARARQREVDEVRKADKAREHWTLCRAARDYHERAIETTKTTKHAADWINSLENHLPASLWRKPIEDIDPPELLQALTGITAHERARRVEQGSRVAETTMRIRQRLDAIFEDAIFHKRCTSNPAAAVRRKMRETLPKQRAGQLAALPYREAPAFMQRLQQQAGTAARCFELALLTAARTNEVLSAEWSEFDLDEGLWIVPAEKMKAKEEHAVFLSSRALELLRELRGLKLHERIVFPSRMLADAPLSNMAMLTVLNRMGMRDRTTVHGLCRSTFSTWANETGAARPDVIEACLAHHERDKVRAAYNRAQFNDERRALLKAWAEYLARPAAAVIPIDRAA